MDIKPLAFAVAGAVAGVVGAGALKVSAAPGAGVADILDAKAGDGPAVERFRSNMNGLCGAWAQANAGFDRVRASKGVTATVNGPGNFSVSSINRAASIAVDLKVSAGVYVDDEKK